VKFRGFDGHNQDDKSYLRGLKENQRLQIKRLNRPPNSRFGDGRAVSRLGL
jgi:hypothetical protein